MARRKNPEIEISRRNVYALRREAAEAGDAKMVRICDVALDEGEDSAEWAECARVIASARAMGD